MKKLIFIIIIFTLFSYCKTENTKINNIDNKQWCDSIDKIILNNLLEYSFSNNDLFLDTVSSLIDTALCVCEKGEWKFIYRKLILISERKQYLEAVPFISSLDFLISEELPYFNDYIIYRYKAMYYDYNSDFNKRDSCLRIIHNQLNNFINNNIKDIEKMVKEPDMNNITNNSLIIPLFQYFYINKILYGDEKVNQMLDNLKKVNGINAKVPEEIKFIVDSTDFLQFSGF